ncbi:MAG TPA: 4-(cytidine 5'-diphospho)-2-C-methyl-D-erythritol kinase [Phycisphaerales bacterium]|nr:4-(cytidine 5'-diphospho)-2-C-methyl-D-erythritol kinase [Phycisphaerales bacterium]
MWQSVIYAAPAKLNLALAVGPAQPPRGYHPICSWMVTVDLQDELQITRLAEDRLSRYAILWHKDAKRRSEIDWSISKDLAVRAHLALEKKTERNLPLQLKLEKRIPVGGGLGGGSSDAAAMLIAVNDVFELGMSRDELAAIGSELGSDVPFLVHGGSALVRGLGEQIELRESDEGNLSAVVAFPSVSCPTGKVYGLFDEIRAGNGGLRTADVESLVNGDARIVRNSEGLFNDLAEPALRIAPQLEEHLRDIERIAERRAHVSGSGSSLFVMCDNPLHADMLAKKVEEETGLPTVSVKSSGGVKRL